MLLFPQQSGPAQAGIVRTDNAPAWLIHEKGKQLFDSGDYGEALFYFRAALAKHGVYPEVEYWIGRVFEAEGEYVLAERQYLTAIENGRYLEVPNEILTIRYRLADIYLTTRNFAGYREQLVKIINHEDAERKKNSIIELPPSLLARSLVENGQNKLLELYRLPDYGGTEAYYRLGIYEYRTGFNEAALEKLTYAVVISFTIVIEYLIDRDPEYRFTTLDELLDTASRIRDLADFMVDVDAFGQLYATAAALHASREPQKIARAEELWRAVSVYDEFWGRRARRQLQSPFVDDFMIVLPE